MKPHTEKALKTLATRTEKLSAVADYILENTEALESDLISLFYICPTDDAIIIIPVASGEGKPIARLFPCAGWEKKETQRNNLSYKSTASSLVELEIHHAEVNPIFHHNTDEHLKVIL
jgi:hypothetical protein